MKKLNDKMLKQLGRHKGVVVLTKNIKSVV